MSQGYVKWFSDAKGYGFISCADTAGDIFVHFSAIVMSGYKSLATDMQVVFDLVETPKGFMAQNVQVHDDPNGLEVGGGECLSGCGVEATQG